MNEPKPPAPKAPQASQPSPAVRAALMELQSYLSDQLAPLMVADSIDELIAVSPRLVASAIEAWVATQYRGGGDEAGLADYLFHAMKKIHMMSALKLIPGERMTPYIEALGKIVVEMVPQEDRESFKITLKGLEQAEVDMSTSVQLLRGGGGPGAGAAGARPRSKMTSSQSGSLSEEVTRGLKRFSLLLQRLSPGMKAEAAMESGGVGTSTTGGGAARAGAAAGPQSELMTQILTTAALNSRSGADLNLYMQKLAEAGVNAQTEQVFRALGRSLPGWALPAAVVEKPGPSPLATSRPAEAMQRLVSMAESPTESMKRFTEMVHAAIEQFNDGQLSKAAAMFEVAEKLIADKKIDAESSRLVRDRTHVKLSPEVLRGFAEKPEKHASLRRVLNFFPAMSVSGLMTDLDGEEKRDRRKMILALLEVHGAAAREAAVEKLSARLAAGEVDQGGFFTRNLIFLLRRIPRAGDDGPEKEVNLISHFVKWGQPLIVIKEAIGSLGQIHHVTSEQALVGRMKEYESLLLESEATEFDDEEIKVLLDRIASCLARMGTPNGWRTVVNHALQKQPRLGNTMARMADLSGQDLSADKELADHLVATLRAELPKKVLGFVMQKKSESVVHLVQAVSGTQSAAVKQVLQEIVDRYPDQEFGKAASKALSGFGVAARPAEAAAPTMSLSGDLDLFGLPTLMQTVADARMSGVLALTDREGHSIANVDFQTGQVRTCVVGALTGEEAFCQLFERPIPGSFLFKSRREPAPPAEGDQGAAQSFVVLPAMLEAMRRHDEFQQSRAVVPDDASMKPSGVKPTGPPEGEDPAFLRAVWAQASSGATPMACETAVPADSYRIRRLYAQWLEQGALQTK